jgi:tripartite-type tricarboxylate transporter receptor subunit TctC
MQSTHLCRRVACERFKRRARPVVAVLMVSFIALQSPPVLAQEFPSRTIRLVTAGPPGSVPDSIARPLSEKLAASLHQPVIVENHPSAGGIVAMDLVAKARPDGYVVGLVSTAQMVFNTYLFEKLPYEAMRDFAPVSLLVIGQGAIAANPAFPANSMRELIALAKERPGRIDYAVPQMGAPPHIYALEVAKAAGIDMVAIPFHTSSEAVASVLAGEVPILFEAPFIIAPYVRAGRLKALAIIGPRREPLLANTPTLEEIGLPGVVGEAWLGLVVPAHTPTNVVHTISEAVRHALNEADLRLRFSELGWQIVASSADDFAATLERDHDVWSRVIRTTGLHLQ